MIGVVVWADTAKHKAVIWCEDQKDLAYYLPADGEQDTVAPDRGDIVKFETCYKGSLRVAKNLRVTDQSMRGDLADVLQEGAHRPRRNNIHRGATLTTLSFPERVDQDCSSDRSGDRGARRDLRGRKEEKSATILRFPELMRA